VFKEQAGVSQISISVASGCYYQVSSRSSSPHGGGGGVVFWKKNEEEEVCVHSKLQQIQILRQQLPILQQLLTANMISHNSSQVRDKTAAT